MKRRYAAMVLGMALAFTSVSAYATEETAADVVVEEVSESASEEVLEEEASDEEQEAITEGEVLWGEVTGVEDGTLTVLLGTLTEDAEQTAENVAIEDSAAEDAEQTAEDVPIEESTAGDAEQAADATEENAEFPESGEAQDEKGSGVVLAPNGEEFMVEITDETPVYLVYGNTSMERIMAVASELGNTDEEDPAGAAEAAANLLPEAEMILEVSEAEERSEEEAESEEGAADAENAELTEDSEDAENTEEGSEVTDDTEALAEAFESVPEMAEENADAASVPSETVVNETTLDSILEGDLVGLLMNEDGSVSAVMIVLPEMEVVAEAE